MTTLEITAGDLAIGDIITDGKVTYRVNKIEPCRSTLRYGIPKIHVNGTNCYDSIAVIEITRKGRMVTAHRSGQDAA